MAPSSDPFLLRPAGPSWLIARHFFFPSSKIMGAECYFVFFRGPSSFVLWWWDEECVSHTSLYRAQWPSGSDRSVRRSRRILTAPHIFLLLFLLISTSHPSCWAIITHRSCLSKHGRLFMWLEKKKKKKEKKKTVPCPVSLKTASAPLSLLKKKPLQLKDAQPYLLLD